MRHGCTYNRIRAATRKSVKGMKEAVRRSEGIATWNATTRSIETPVRMTCDLDPAGGLAWPLMLEAAQLVRAFLDELGLRCFNDQWRQGPARGGASDIAR